MAGFGNSGLRMTVVAAALVAACGGGVNRVEVPAGSGAPPELGASLNVRVSGDTVRFELHITNTTGAPVTVMFPSAQRFDFAVTRGSGETVWSWSADRMFAQVLGEERVGAGESRRYEAEWIAPGQTGDYVATGRLTSSNYPVELRTVFRLPGE